MTTSAFLQQSAVPAKNEVESEAPQLSLVTPSAPLQALARRSREESAAISPEEQVGLSAVPEAAPRGEDDDVPVGSDEDLTEFLEALSVDEDASEENNSEQMEATAVPAREDAGTEIPAPTFRRKSDESVMADSPLPRAERSKHVAEELPAVAKSVASSPLPREEESLAPTDSPRRSPEMLDEAASPISEARRSAVLAVDSRRENAQGSAAPNPVAADASITTNAGTAASITTNAGADASITTNAGAAASITANAGAAASITANAGAAASITTNAGAAGAAVAKNAVRSGAATSSPTLPAFADSVAEETADSEDSREFNELFFRARDDQQLYNLGQSFHQDFITGSRVFGFANGLSNDSQKRTILGIASFISYFEDARILIITDTMEAGFFSRFRAPRRRRPLGNETGLCTYQMHQFHFMELDPISNRRHGRDNHRMLQTVMDGFDVVLCDLPALEARKGSYDVYLPILRAMESVTLTVGLGRNRFSEVQRMKNYFAAYNIKIKGSVIDRDPSRGAEK